jgi:hypothetical protein
MTTKLFIDDQRQQDQAPGKRATEDARLTAGIEAVLKCARRIHWTGAVRSAPPRRSYRGHICAL